MVSLRPLEDLPLVGGAADLERFAVEVVTAELEDLAEWRMGSGKTRIIAA